MNIEQECLDCIYAQAQRVCNILDIQGSKKNEILKESYLMVQNMDFNLNPPQNATPMYSMIASKLNTYDLYHKVKTDSIKYALEFSPYTQNLIDNAEDKLYTATKVAIIGNVIDLASQVQFDLKDEVNSIMNIDFAIDDYNLLEQKLKTANNIVYLADNAGEDVFDKLYIKTIKEFYPNINIYYFVRGAPIINDLTVSDLSLSQISEVATIIDSKAITPGIVRDKLVEREKKLFENADLIISKGMGNYECLNTEVDLDIFYLLKVKCEVVALSLNTKLGDIICKAGKKI